MQDVDILAMLDKLQISFKSECLRLQTDYPSWDAMTDERIIVFSKMFNVISSTKIGFFFGVKYLNSSKWWEDHPAFEEDKGSSRSLEFTNYIKVSFIQALFSVNESAHRQFIRAIDPDACSGGTAPFENIYSSLIARITVEGKNEIKNSLDVWREIRNAIHNNMVYSHKSGRDKVIVYKGQSLALDINKPLNFVQWKLLLSLTDDLRVILSTVVRSPELNSKESVFGPANFRLKNTMQEQFKEPS